MPSQRTVGAAPLITGILLAFQSAGTLVQSGLALWSVLGLVGGCAAIVIGLGTLRGWDAFERETIGNDRPSVAVLGLAAAAFFAGVAIAIA
ncbi:hypothetical protein A6E15_06975 [Natrinema saccharevitans]|uniref:Uncharacterized protein n=1 Tax=Natrinema saccharevitans TaxID=301967 RepID=A0A1S8AVW6_9EURY|nr:hypothetical protein [Natrinema saccharevitans]OLZ40747.1 hypothetical protein A6E15_06975 [Natrinema saccharevitans]